MRRYKRTVGRLCAAMLTLAVLIRILTQTGLDVRAGQALARAVSSPDLVSFLVYLELGEIGTWPSDGPSPAAPVQPTPEPGLSDADGEEPEQADDSPAEPDREEPVQATDSLDEPSQEQPDETPTETPAGTQAQEPPPQTAEPKDAPLTFTQADADAISINSACTYSVDKLHLLRQPGTLDFDQEGPTVLIVHTHTSEAYTQEAGWEYEENDTARTQDPNYSVIRVGAELAETLQAHGISVIHDTSFNDYPSYNGAYNRTLQKIEDWLELYPSIQMVIDLHRDAASNDDGTPVSHTADIGGESTAQIMLVMGTDAGGLSHPNWRGNLSWALKYQAVLNRMYPGLCRNLNLRTERFNQHATPGSMLIEVGSSGNTLKQAIAAARDLGEGLAALISGT